MYFVFSHDLKILSWVSNDLEGSKLKKYVQPLKA